MLGVGERLANVVGNGDVGVTTHGHCDGHCHGDDAARGSRNIDES